MPYIVDVYAREVLDSRGNPTVEVEVYTESGALDARWFQAELPLANTKLLSFATATKTATLERRLTAVNNVNEIIAPELIGFDVTEQVSIDKLLIELDGTEIKASSAPTPSLVYQWPLPAQLRISCRFLYTNTLEDSTLKRFLYR
ncbi:hypothetical protein PO124_11200 [Bacillus licheniformis]|nr:hypothetical protein [Bacillus licheniformis]